MLDAVVEATLQKMPMHDDDVTVSEDHIQQRLWAPTTIQSQLFSRSNVVRVCVFRGGVGEDFVVGSESLLVLLAAGNGTELVVVDAFVAGHAVVHQGFHLDFHGAGAAQAEGGDRGAEAALAVVVPADFLVFEVCEGEELVILLLVPLLGDLLRCLALLEREDELCGPFH